MSPPNNDANWSRWQGVVETKLDQVLSAVKELGGKFESHETVDDERFKEINDKHAALDSKVNWWSGAAAAVGACVGWAISYVTGKPQ